jgi:hypothetical protein
MCADAIAPAIHESWLRSVEPNRKKLHPDQTAYLTQFEQLPAAAMADNYAAARRIVDVLALIGLFLVRAHQPSDSDPSIVQQLIDRHIELLAEAAYQKRCAKTPYPFPLFGVTIRPRTGFRKDLPGS